MIRVVLGKPLDARELERESRGEELHQKIARALHDAVGKLATE